MIFFDTPLTPENFQLASKLYTNLSAVDLVSSVIQDNNTPALARILDRYDAEYTLVKSEVISVHDMKEQELLITRFIETAQQFLALNNFHSLFSFVSALQTTVDHVSSRDAWADLPKKIRKIFEKLLEFVNSPKV